MNLKNITLYLSKKLKKWSIFSEVKKYKVLKFNINILHSNMSIY